MQLRHLTIAIGLSLVGSALLTTACVRQVLSPGQDYKAGLVRRHALAEFGQGQALFMHHRELIWSPNPVRPELDQFFPIERECGVHWQLGSLILRCPTAKDSIIAIVSVLPDPLIEGTRLDRRDTRNPLLSSIPAALRKYPVDGLYWTREDGLLRPRWRSRDFGSTIQLTDSIWLRSASHRDPQTLRIHVTCDWWERGELINTRRLEIPELRHIDAIALDSEGIRLHTWFSRFDNPALGHIDLEARTLRRLDTPNVFVANVRRKAVLRSAGLGVVIAWLGRRRFGRLAQAALLLGALAVAAWLGPQLLNLMTGSFTLR